MRENYRNSIASIKKFPQFTTMHVIDGQAGLIICASLIFYSLTIDNILNIIVLLILAGISISMLSGDNSILNQAGRARDLTDRAQFDEDLQLAVLGGYDNTGSLNAGKVKENIEKQVSGVTVSGDSFPLTVTKGEDIYIVESDGTVGEKKLTEEATGIYISTLNYTDNTESDDSKILTIDGAMLLSAGSQAVPSRVQNEKFIWKSSNTNVATVTSDGVVKCGTETGTATITLKGKDNTESKCRVKTTAKIAKEKSGSNYTLNGGEGSDLNPTIPGGFYAIDTNLTGDSSKDIDWKLTRNQTNTGKGLVIMNDAGDQFVWVPVKKDEVVLDTTNLTTPSTSAVTVSSELYTPMATTYTYNGKTYYRGMLYTFSGDTTSTTVKYESNWAPDTTSYREPSLVTGNSRDKWAPMTSVTGTTYDAQYYTNAGFTEAQEVTGFGAKMQEDYDEMITQVQAYGGFWVGRFESSWNDKTKKVASVAGAKSFTNADKSDKDEVNMWYGLYRTHKAYSNNSSMIWGSQYDAMMNWMAKNGITVGVATVMSGTTINVGNNATNGQRITGNPKYNDKISNVIDIYGNSHEWTLEAIGTIHRAYRGGHYDFSSLPGYRGYNGADLTNGFSASRLSLYIK